MSNLKTLLGFKSSVRFAECTQCRTCSSPKLRQCPNCKASFPQHYVIRKWTASDTPDDRVEVFITCPGCGRSLKPETKKCLECDATISREYASQSIKDNCEIGQAYVTAQKIDATNPYAILSLAMTVGFTACAYFFDLPLVVWFLLMPFIITTGALLFIKQWFRWFGSYKSDQGDFVTARRKVKHTLRRWLAVLAAEFSIAVLMLAWLILRK